MSPRREGRASGDGHGDADGGGRHHRRRSGSHRGRDEGRHSGKGHDDAKEGGRQRRGRSGDHGGRDDGRDSADRYEDADGGGRRRRGRSGDHGGRDDGRDSADGYDDFDGAGRRRRGAYRKSGPGGESRSHGGGGSLHPRASGGVSRDSCDRGHHSEQEQGRKHHHHRSPKGIREATSSFRALTEGTNDRGKDTNNLKRKRNEHDNNYDDHDLKRPCSRKSEIQQNSADVRTRSKYHNESASHYQQNNGEPRESRNHQTGRQTLTDSRGKKQHKSGGDESPGSISLSDIERSVKFDGRLVKRTIKGQGNKAEQDKKVDIMYALDRLRKEKEMEAYKPSFSEWKPSFSVWNEGLENRYPQVHHDRYLPERPDLEQFQLITDRFEPKPESPVRFLH